ncbi:MAG: nucleotide exchange factor GrpE [Spirochaetaceae bacterium]|nr:nucleotide exchange factor GrpE [Spirochaetaceae bacterium]
MSESKKKTEEEQEAVQTAADENTEEQAAAEQPEKEEPKEPSLEEKYAELEKQNAKLKDDYLRKVADFDNYRKRMIKEKQDAFDYANTAILTDLVAILDDFDRGLAAMQDATDVKSVIDGIKMINKQMKGFLESKYDLSSYCEPGDAFDPNIHEALSSVPADVEEPVCAEVYLKGYKLKDRVIRHAKVLVNMPKPKTEETEKEEADTSAEN